MDKVNEFITWLDGIVWGIPLILVILLTGIYLTIRLKFLQFRHLGKALKYMVKKEEGGTGEVTSFGALCTALSATIGTGNIVGVATAIAAGGPGALFWMEIAAFFGMATKYAEGLLAIRYRTIDSEGHVLGGPFYYIENGMGKKWKWLAKTFAFFGEGVCWASEHLRRSTVYHRLRQISLTRTDSTLCRSSEGTIRWQPSSPVS